MSVLLKPVPGFPRYMAGTDGSVWSLGRQGWQQMKATPRKTDGYVQVALSAGGKVTREYVHRLVLLAFVGPW